MKKFVYIIIVFWIVLVCGITTHNEIILRNSQEVLLKVTPVDPRDLLRGDYVSLNYEINTMPDDINIEKIYKRRNVYVTLTKQPDKTYKISGIYFNAPKDKIFLRGELYGRRIYYPGIDKYFVKQGQGKEIENKLRNGGIVKVSATKNGSARIKEIITDK